MRIIVTFIDQVYTYFVQDVMNWHNIHVTINNGQAKRKGKGKGKKKYNSVYSDQSFNLVDNKIVSFKLKIINRNRESDLKIGISTRKDDRPFSYTGYPYYCLNGVTGDIHTHRGYQSGRGMGWRITLFKLYT